MIWKIVIAGVGGQGIISAGVLLAETAVLHEGRYGVQSQTYGAEMRGGLSRTDVTISDEEVIYPRVDQAHILACLHTKAREQYRHMVRPGGLIIADEHETPVPQKMDCRRIELPIIATVREQLGTDRSANMCLLGVIATVTDVVGWAPLEAAVRRRYPDTTDALEALRWGQRISDAFRIDPEHIPRGNTLSGRHATSARL